MAPSTALLFVLYGLATFLRARVPLSAGAYRMGVVVNSAGALIALLLLLLSSLGIRPAAEHFGVPVAGTLGDAPVGHMSTVTAICFVLASLSFLASRPSSSSRPGRARIAWWSAGVLLATSSVLLLAYLYGTPLLYGASSIPPAVTSSLAFAALGIALLALAGLQAWPQSDLAGPDPRASYALLLAFLLLAVGIVTIGGLHYQDYTKRRRAEVAQQLSAIAALKVGELVQYRRERLGDGLVFFENAAFSALVRRAFDHPNDREAHAALRTWLGRYREHYQYDRVFLLDARGAEWMAAPEGRVPVASVIARRVSEILRSGDVTLQDFHRNEHDQKVYLTVLVPMLDGPGGRRALGVLGLRIDPETYLYPFLRRWPTPSRTAETLLLRRDGTDALFLNDLKFQAHTALALRIPLASQDVPAVKAALGQEGIVDGRDYRGVPVLAAVRKVPGFPWFLVARMDVAEVDAPLGERLWVTIMLVGGLLLGAGASLGLVWRQQHVRFYAAQYRTEKALGDSRALLEAIVTATSDAVYAKDPQGRYLLFNAAAERFTGKSQAATLGRDDTVLFPPAEAAVVMEGDRTAMNAGGPTTFEEVVTGAGGTVRTFLSTKGPLFDARGTRVGLFGIARDITERKQAETALRESEQRYRQIVDTAGEGIWMIDRDARTTYVNERMATMLGYEPGEMLGRSLYDFVDAETRPAVAQGLERLKPGVVDRNDLRCRRKNRSPLWAIVAMTPVADDEGRILGALGMFTDITARRRAQKAAQALAEVGREIAASLDVAQVTDRIVFAVLRLLSARRSTFWLLDAASGALVCIATAGESDRQAWIGRVLPPGTSIAGRAATAQQPVHTENLFKEPGLALPDWIVERLRAEQCSAIAAAPLRFRGEVLGVLSIGDSLGRVFTDEELRLLAAFADMSAVALKNARLYEAERVRAIRQGTLARLNQVVSSSLNLDQTLEAIATAAGELLGTSSVGVCIADEAAGILTRPAVFTDVYSQEHFRFGEGIVGWAAAHRQPANVPDVFADERIFSRDWFRSQGFTSALAIPIVADGSLLGVLSFVGQRSFVIEPDTQDLMDSFVGQAAAAIRNAQLHAETERRRREAEALERSARMLAESLDPGDVGQRIVESVVMLFHGKSSSLRLLEPDGRLRLLAVSGQDADHYAPGHFLPPDEGTLAAASAAARPVRALDVLTDPAIRLGLDLRARLERSGERSALAVPLRAKGAVVGALGVNDVLGRTFSDADAALLQAFADHAAVALENAQLHQRMQSARARLSVLSRRLLEVQETEHRNLARELHDGIGQALTAVKLNLQLLQGSRLDAASTRIQETIEIVDVVLEEVRDLSLSLRPSVLDDLGLAAALRWYVRREAERAGLEADLDVEPLEPGQAPEIETTCFRIVQEAVTNVIRHAKAGRLSVKLTRRDGELELTVRDDGVGFDVDQAHARATLGKSLGLLGMEERATLVGGRLEIQSAEGLGATVHVRLPVAMREGT